LFFPQASAEHFKPLKREAIISITGTGHVKARLQRGWTRVLRIVFDDVEIPNEGSVHFDDSHAEAIVSWLDAVEDRVDKVFVHCHAGKRRSAAVAKFIAERYEIPGGIHVYPNYNQRVYRVLARHRRKKGYSSTSH
jgi:predicted protein tyrosine phosphatase